jgi:hypothetical protein
VRTHKELSFTTQTTIEEFFHKEKLNYVIVVVANMGRA